MTTLVKVTKLLSVLCDVSCDDWYTIHAYMPVDCLGHFLKFELVSFSFQRFLMVA